MTVALMTKTAESLMEAKRKSGAMQSNFSTGTAFQKWRDSESLLLTTKIYRSTMDKISR